MDSSVSNNNRLPPVTPPPQQLSADIVGSKVAVKINKSNLSGKIYSGKNQKSYFDTRPLKLLFVKQVKVNVKYNRIDGAVMPVLFKKSDLKKALDVSEKELNALLAVQDGDLESVVQRSEELKKAPLEQRSLFYKAAKYAKEIHTLNEGQILERDGHLLHKSEGGKPRVYRNAGAKLGEGSFKVVTLFDRVKGGAMQKAAFAEVKLTGDAARDDRHISQANEEYFQGKDFYDTYKDEHGKDAIPFCKYYLAKDCTQKVSSAPPSTFRAITDKLKLTKEEQQEAQPQTFGFMMEYADTDLKHAAMTPEQKGDVFLGILKGVNHMHKLGFVHRDLKPGNIRLKTVEKDGEEHFQPKLIDFGLSSKVGDSYRYAGTRTYSPPETFNARIDRSDLTKLDSWSLGVILYKMHYGRDPPFKTFIQNNFPKNQNPSWELVKSITERMRTDVAYLESKVESMDKADAVVDEAILHLLDSDPATRWSVDEALAHLQEAQDTYGSLRIG